MLSNGSRIIYVVELWHFCSQSCPTCALLEHICSALFADLSPNILQSLNKIKNNSKSPLMLPIEQSCPVQLGSQLQSPVSGRKVPWPEHWSRQVALGVSQFVPPQPTEQWHSPRTHTPRPEQVGSMQSTTGGKEEEADRESKRECQKKRKPYQTPSTQTYLYSISRLQPESKAPLCTKQVLHARR